MGSRCRSHVGPDPADILPGLRPGPTERLVPGFSSHNRMDPPRAAGSPKSGSLSLLGRRRNSGTMMGLNCFGSVPNLRNRGSSLRVQARKLVRKSIFFRPAPLDRTAACIRLSFPCSQNVMSYFAGLAVLEKRVQEFTASYRAYAHGRLSEHKSRYPHQGPPSGSCFARPSDELTPPGKPHCRHHPVHIARSGHSFRASTGRLEQSRGPLLDSWRELP